MPFAIQALPAPKAFRLVKGATFSYDFLYATGSPDNATPMDLTNYTAAWTLHTAPTVTTYTQSTTLDASGVHFGGNVSSPDPTTGVIELVIAASDTATFAWKTVKYNLAITSPNSVVTNLLTGSMTIVNTLP